MVNRMWKMIKEKSEKLIFTIQLYYKYICGLIRKNVDINIE